MIMMIILRHFHPDSAPLQKDTHVLDATFRKCEVKCVSGKIKRWILTWSPFLVIRLLTSHDQTSHDCFSSFLENHAELIARPSARRKPPNTSRHLTDPAVETHRSLIIITQLAEVHRFYWLPLPSNFSQVTLSASDQVRGLTSDFILHPHKHLLLLCSRLCPSLSHSVKPCQVVGFTGLWMSLRYALAGASWHGPVVPPVRVHLHPHAIGRISCHNPHPRFPVQL